MLVAKVFGREPTADALEVGIDGFGDGAVVVCVAAALGDHAIGAGQVGIAADVAFVRSVAIRRVGVQRVSCLFDP